MSQQSEDTLPPGGESAQSNPENLSRLSHSSLSGCPPSPEVIQAMKNHYRRFAKHEPFRTTFQSGGSNEGE